MSDEPPNNDPREHEPLKTLLAKLFGHVTRWGAIGGLIAISVAGILDIFGDTRVRTWLSVGGLAVGFFLAAHRISPKPFIRYALPLVLSVCVAAVVFVFSKWEPAPERSPLVLSLLSPQFPHLSVYLTNKELFAPVRATTMDVGWMLVVPVTSKDAYATLRLTVENTSEKAVSGYQVHVSLDGMFEFAEGTTLEDRDWRISSAPGGAKGLLAKPAKIYPLKSQPLNDIGFKPPGGWPLQPVVTALMIGLSREDAPPENVGVKLVCPVDPIPHEPYLIPPGGAFQYRGATGVTPYN